jgi:predicted TIM-barrel fold metal-dependent hydrolase
VTAAAFPLIVSADDHIIEPKDLWSSRLPRKYADIGPRVVRERGSLTLRGGEFIYEASPQGEEVDVWYYEDVREPSRLTAAAAGFDLDDMEIRVITFDDMRPGCYEQEARLSDMDAAGIEASICFPGSFVRFCGQRFNFGKDHELSLLCVQAYNDYMIDEWTAGSNGRLIPLGIIPLWDATLAAQEVRRIAARGARAVCFSEIPPYLGLPSIHTDYWDPFFEACNETGLVIMMHIGSSSRLPVTSADAPAAVQNTLPAVNSAMSMVDWLFSGVLVRYPRLRVVYAESQIGWVPYFLQRSDEVWLHNRGWNEVWEKLKDPPSTQFPEHMFCTFFSDPFGLAHIDEIGRENVLFECDYPHSDTNWPDSLKIAQEQTAGLDAETTELVIRGNARRLFGLA